MHSWQPLAASRFESSHQQFWKEHLFTVNSKDYAKIKKKAGQKLSISCRKEFIYPIEASFYFSGLGNFFCLMLNNINPDDYEGEATGGESEKCPTWLANIWCGESTSLESTSSG